MPKRLAALLAAAVAAPLWSAPKPSAPAGKWIDTIEIPERPLQLVFGGKDGQTLFIPARSSL